MTADPLAGRPVIIGGGIAGLAVALALAPEPVLLLAGAPLGHGAASAWAQGGIAAAIGPGDDPAAHLADTLAAGAGLVDPDAARGILDEAPAAIEALAQYGVAFDRDAAGRLSLGLEAGHAARRIVHAAGDGSGREIMRALAEAARATPSISIREGIAARRLLLRDGAIAGVLAAEGARPVLLPTTRVVLATGGLGGLYAHTTNPRAAVGVGLALAARAGALLADLEFVQFHPTALDVGRDPMPLVSEAVRGEGAVLTDETGARFMAGEGRAELSPRDVVSRAVWRHGQQGHRVFLDARVLGAGFAVRFPGIDAACRAAGIDPARTPIPVRPAAHYHMGGIAVDAWGRSLVPGLWACGEVARTGLHGANRLASNSLLEAVVCGRRVAAGVAGTTPGRARPLAPAALPPPPDATPVRGIMDEALGVLRDGKRLRQAVAALLPRALGRGADSDPALVALMLAVAALRRTECRGAHHRTDAALGPARPGVAGSLRLADALRDAASLADAEPSPALRA